MACQRVLGVISGSIIHALLLDWVNCNEIAVGILVLVWVVVFGYVQRESTSYAYFGLVGAFTTVQTLYDFSDCSDTKAFISVQQNTIAALVMVVRLHTCYKRMSAGGTLGRAYW